MTRAYQKMITEPLFFKKNNGASEPQYNYDLTQPKELDHQHNRQAGDRAKKVTINRII